MSDSAAMERPLWVYLDFSDLKRLISDESVRSRWSQAIEAVGAQLVLSPIHLFELHSGNPDDLVDGLVQLADTTIGSLMLPEPGVIFGHNLSGTIQVDLDCVELSHRDHVLHEYLKHEDHFQRWMQVADNRAVWIPQCIVEGLNSRECSRPPSLPSLADRFWQREATRLQDRDTQRDRLSAFLSRPHRPMNLAKKQHAVVDGLLDGLKETQESVGKWIKQQALAEFGLKLAGRCVHSIRDVDLFLFAQNLRFLGKAFLMGKSLSELFAENGGAETSLDLVLLLAEEQCRDKNRRSRYGDFADLLHIGYLSSVDVMTLDKHKYSLVRQVIERRGNERWQPLGERLFRSGAGLVSLIDKLERLGQELERRA